MSLVFGISFITSCKTGAFGEMKKALESGLEQIKEKVGEQAEEKGEEERERGVIESGKIGEQIKEKHTDTSTQSSSISCTGAKSIKTKKFCRDLNRAKGNIQKQYSLLMMFFERLNPEDIDELNGKGHCHKYIDDNLVPIIIKLDRARHGAFDCKRCLSTASNLFTDDFYILAFSDIFEEYHVPKKDYDVAIKNYSLYVYDFLDKYQELRLQAKSIGLEMKHVVCRINGVSVFGLFSHDEGYVFIRDNCGFSRELMYHWKESTKNIPNLYSNKTALKAVKYFLSYVLEDIPCARTEERIMAEIEKIDKKLVESVPKDQIKKTKSQPSSTDVEKKKSKFKLDIPD